MVVRKILKYSNPAQLHIICSLVPRLLPYRKAGREPGRSDHVSRDILCVVLCVVLMIELLPTQSVLSVISADMVIVICRWDYKSALKDCFTISS